MRILLSQYYRYVLAGIIVTGFDFIILIALTELLQVYYLISACFGYIFASVLHYFLSINYIFNKRILKNKYSEFFIFFLIGVISLILFEILIYFFTEQMKLHYVSSKIVITGLLFTFNFILRKYILF